MRALQILLVVDHLDTAHAMARLLQQCGHQVAVAHNAADGLDMAAEYLDTEKLTKLNEMLAKQPNDPVLLYGMALEHKKLNEPAKAIEFLDRVIASDANYCYAYYQRGQILEAMGDAVGAAQSY